MGVKIMRLEGSVMQAIHFETVVESGIIRIPEQYIGAVPAAVKVTLIPVSEPRIKAGKKAGAGALSPGDFSALKIDTQNWMFSRDEANERH
jgi:hypothetical protein